MANTKHGTAAGVDINVDLTDNKNLAATRKVTLSADYVMLSPYTVPTRPDFTGAKVRDYPHTILSGTVITLHKGEADALVAAGKAS